MPTPPDKRSYLVDRIDRTCSGLVGLMMALEAHGHGSYFGGMGPGRQEDFPVEYQGPPMSLLKTKPWEDHLISFDAETAKPYDG